MRKLLKSAVFVMSAVLLLTSLQLPAFSAGSAEAQQSVTESIDFDLTSYRAENASVNYRDNALNWVGGTGNISFSFNAPQTGNYNLFLLWQPESSGLDISLGIKIDGNYPFDGADEIVLKRIWRNKEEKPRTDGLGNEYASEQVEAGGYIEDYLCDTSGISNGPHEFYLTAGNHTLMLLSPMPYEMRSAPESKRIERLTLFDQ